MDPQKAKRLIQTQPQKADAQAREWSVFASEHPGVSHFVLKQEFDAWARTHGISDTSVWFGKEIQDAYFYLRKQHEEEQLETQGHIDHDSVPTGLAALRFLSMVFLRERPRIMEEDPDFKRILKEKGQTWLDDHPDKDVTSKEWVDYRYGSLENPDAPTLYKKTEEAFREKYEKRVKTYYEERKKVHSDPTQDPAIIWHQEEVILHTQARHELLKQESPSITIAEEQKQVETYHWERFVEKHPEKANVYAQKHEGIKLAVSRIEERKKQTAAPKIETKPVVEPTSPRPPIIAQTSISPKPSQVNQQLPQSFETTPSLSFQTAQPPPFPIQRVPSSISPPSAPPVGGAGRLGNFPNPGRNPLAGLGNALARARLLVNPLFIIIGVVTITFIFTLITIIAGPATIGEASPEQTGGGTLGYAIAFRNTSILPADPDAAKEAIRKEFPSAQLQYWDTIISQSLANGWNPAFVLALWIEETGASHYTITENGGGGGGPPDSLGHLGCAPKENQTIDESLRCLFGSKNIFSSLTNDQFEKFMCEYGGIAPRTPPCVFETPSFPAKIKKYYSLLVPSGNGLTNIASGQIIPVGQGGERIASTARQIAEQLLRWDDPRRDYPCDEKNSINLGRSLSGQYSYHCWSEMTSYNYAGAGNENYFECTEFVRAAFIKALGKDLFDNIYTDAGGWANKASGNPNFSVFYKARDLQPGDIIEMPLHMAIVIKVDGQEVKIAQAATSDAPTMTFRIDNQGLLDMPTGSSLYCGQTQGCNVSFIRYNQ